MDTVQSFVEPRQTSPSWSLDLDVLDERYLLTGSCKGSIALYDTSTHHATSSAREPLAMIPRAPKGSSLDPSVGHEAGVTDIEWFPSDNGIFTSCSHDSVVKVWDTEVLQAAVVFKLPKPVYCSSISRAPGPNTEIVAVASDTNEVRLCDIVSGTSTHSLIGHRDSVRVVKWSPVHPYELCSGGRDGAIRLWDVRKSGATACLLSFDHQGYAQQPRRYEIHAAKKPRCDNDPHVAATYSTAIAHGHNGVKTLCYTPDGRYIVSLGEARRKGVMRLWNSSSGEHQFVNFVDVGVGDSGKIPLAIAQPGYEKTAVIFCPSSRESELAMYSVQTSDGKALKRLETQTQCVVSCVYGQREHKLYCIGKNSVVSVFTCPDIQIDPTLVQDPSNSHPDNDDWSDDDEEGELQTFIPPILR